MSKEKWVEWEDQGQRKGHTEFPKCVQYNRNLTRHARFLYSLLVGYAWQDEECFPGQKTLMADMGCKQEQLVKYMKELKAAKLIDWKRRGQGKPNLYTIKDLDAYSRETPKAESSETPEKGSLEVPEKGSYKETSTEEASTNSRRDADASPEGQNENEKTNWFTVVCNKLKEVGLPISDEDRQRLPQNLIRCYAKEQATDIEMHRLITHLIDRRTKGHVLSPQEALKDVRGIPRKKQDTRFAAEPKRRKKPRICV